MRDAIAAARPSPSAARGGVGIPTRVTIRSRKESSVPSAKESFIDRRPLPGQLHHSVAPLVVGDRELIKQILSVDRPPRPPTGDLGADHIGATQERQLRHFVLDQKFCTWITDESLSTMLTSGYRYRGSVLLVNDHV